MSEKNIILFGDSVADLANTSTGCPVKFEFHKNNKLFLA